MRLQIECPHCGKVAATITQEAAPLDSTVESFVRAQCQFDKDVLSNVALLRGAYERWVAGMGEPAVTAKRFSMELLRIGGVSLTRGTHGVRQFRGIKLR